MSTVLPIELDWTLYDGPKRTAGAGTTAKPGDHWDPMFPGPEHPARAVHLAALQALLLGAATTPYVQAGLVADASSTQQVGWRIGGAVSYLRPGVTRSSDLSSSGTMPTSVLTEAGAAFGAQVPSPFASGADSYPPGDAAVVGWGDMVVDAAPTAAEPRLLAVATPSMAPQTVHVDWDRGCGCTMQPIPSPDCTAL